MHPGPPASTQRSCEFLRRSTWRWNLQGKLILLLHLLGGINPEIHINPWSFAMIDAFFNGFWKVSQPWSWLLVGQSITNQFVPGWSGSDWPQSTAQIVFTGHFATSQMLYSGVQFHYKVGYTITLSMPSHLQGFWRLFCSISVVFHCYLNPNCTAK